MYPNKINRTLRLQRVAMRNELVPVAGLQTHSPKFATPFTGHMFWAALGVSLSSVCKFLYLSTYFRFAGVSRLFL